MDTKRTYIKIGIIAIVGLLVIVIGFLAWQSHTNFERAIVTSTQQLLSRTAKAEAESIEIFVSDLQTILGLVAGDPRVQDAAVNNKSYKDVLSTEGYSLLEAVHKRLAGKVHGLYRLCSKGIIQSRIPWDATRLGDDYSSKPCVKAVLETHKPYVSELFTSRSGITCFSVCYPIFKQKQFVGIIRAAVHLSTIQEMVKQIEVGQKGYVQIIDDDGWLIAHPMQEHVGKDIIATRKEVFPDYDWFELEEVVKKMKSGETGVATYHSAWWPDEEPGIVHKLTAFAPIRFGSELWSLSTVMNYDEISAPVKAHSRKITIGAALLMLILSATGGWFYKIQKEKARLIIETRSAEKLRTVNERLEKETCALRKTESQLQKKMSEVEKARHAAMNMMADSKRAREEVANLAKFPSEDPNPVLRISKDGIVLFANDASEEVLKSWNTSLNDEVPERWQRIITETLETDSSGLEEAVVAGRVLSFGISPVKDAGYVNLYARDITERKRAEEKLRDSEERFRTLFESAPDAIYLIDLEGNFVDGNKAAEALTGFSRNELIGKSFVESGLLCVEQLPKALANLKKNAAGEPTGPDEFVLKQKDGSFVTLEIRTFPVTIGNQKLVLGIGRDISERKQVEDELQESATRYRELFNNMSSGVAVYEPVENGRDFVFKNLNRAGERIDRVKKEAVVGKKVTEMFPGVEQFGLLDVFRRVYKTGKPEHHPVTLYKDDRYSAWFDNYIYKLPSGEIVAVHDDVTENKQAEEEVLNKSAQLRALASRLSSIEEEERRHIAEGIHDSVLQPLVFLDVTLGTLLNVAKDNKMRESFKQMRTILVELVDICRAFTYDLSSPTLNELGLEIAIEEWLGDEIKDKHKIAVEFRAETQTNDLDHSMITFLFKSVKELLINVVKHAQANKVKVSIARKYNNIILCVEDDGCGFDYDSHILKHGKLSGFGLFNIREQLTYLGGNFNVESTPGVGSEVVLAIPLESKD